MSFCANTFLIGAQRSGTTLLANLLGQHPGVCVAESKEPLFFSRYYERGFDWYERQFAEPNAPVTVDASTWYSVAPTRAYPEHRGRPDDYLVGVPERIHAAAPGAKIIYSVRDPAVRLHSLYWMLQRENRDFHGLASLHEGLEREPFFYRSCDYLGQLQNFLQYFDREQILVLVFERTVTDLPGTVGRCLDFLGLASEGFEPGITAGKRNRSFLYTDAGERLARLAGSGERLERMLRLGSRISTGLSGRLEQRLKRDIPPLSEADRRQIQEALATPIDSFADWLEDPLPEWDRPGQGGS